MHRRNITQSLKEALADTPVVLLTGARQTGKTTLARDLAFAPETFPGRYATLDELEVRAAAQADPTGFITVLSTSGEPVILDEIQNVPELLPAIKVSVDRDRRPGRFLLTGSANVLVLPKVSESLAGRIEILPLWPLAQAELAGQEGSLVDFLFSDALPAVLPARAAPMDRADLIDRILTGGFPEALTRSDRRRERWFSSYLTTILQRDIRDLANIEGLSQMPRLLGLLASRSASLLNLADLSRTLPLPYTSLQRYMALLESIYLVRLLPAWSNNIGTRLLKTPKILLTDTGLSAHLMGVSESRLLEDPTLLGGLLENFVALELMKDASWSRTQPSLYHWHTTSREEVDILLEARGGQLVGIEVKASASVTLKDFRGLAALQKSVEKRLHRGIVLYTGQHVLPFGEGFFAVPLSALWSAPPAP
jgi:uncharacterized protein